MLKSNNPQEQLEFLKREEVRTMAKDVAKLHAKEAIEERERISKIKTEPAESPKGIQAGRPPAITSSDVGGPPLMPHEEKRKLVLPKTRTRFEKILIRLVVAGVLIFILFNGIAFGYWYFTKKKVVEVFPESPPSPEATEGQAAPEIEESPVFFFNVPTEKTIELAETEDLLSVLSNVLKEEHQQGFTRILIKKQGTDVFLNTREFLARTNLAMPEPLLSLLREDFMLFVFSSPAKNRLGFVGELTQTQGVQDILKSWETTMEQDTRLLWGVVGQKGKAYVPFFRQTSYKDALVRFQTFSAIDFGIVYALKDNVLLITSSLESMKAALDLLLETK